MKTIYHPAFINESSIRAMPMELRPIAELFNKQTASYWRPSKGAVAMMRKRAEQPGECIDVTEEYKDDN